MKRTLILLLGLGTAGGCDLNIPNGVFSCVAPSDCPSGYFCWNSDGLCYDTKEPEPVCDPASCEEVVAQFAALGVTVECGTLPDGCDGFVECPPCEDGSTCGANGQSLVCGCEPNTCSSGSAECGQVELGCGSDAIVDCGTCPGELQCFDNRCACPEGQDCGAPCGGCGVGEICVEDECCMPLFPCADNECSPPGGLPDGCGGLVECPPCAQGDECRPLTSNGAYACIDDCTCEAQGVECGTSNVCGRLQLCGVCEDPGAPLCDDGRCVCRDPYERNDDPATAAPLDCNGPCPIWGTLVEVEGTLEGPGDYDFYRLDLGHSDELGVRVDVAGLQSEQELFLTYVCPSGLTAEAECSGSSSSVGGTAYCVEDAGETLRLAQSCEGSFGGPASVIVGITSKEGGFAGPCDTYVLTVSTQPELD
jgi:hypothetical protein